MSLSYKNEVVLVGLTALAEAKIHDPETFTPQNIAFFQNIYSALTSAGIDVDVAVNRMLADEIIDFDELNITPFDVVEIESAFRTAGLGSSLPSQTV